MNPWFQLHERGREEYLSERKCRCLRLFLWHYSSYLKQTLLGTAPGHFCCQPKLSECPLSVGPCGAGFAAQTPSQSCLGLWWSRRSGRHRQLACSGLGAIHSPPNERRRSSMSTSWPGKWDVCLQRNNMCILNYVGWYEKGRNLIPTSQNASVFHACKMSGGCKDC